MTTNIHRVADGRDRELQRDARAWQRFTGMKYTRALRLMQHPLTQGILGERVSARNLIRTLTEHPVLRALDAEPPATNLGEFGLWRSHDAPLEFTNEHDFLEVVLSIEVLRMFTVIAMPSDEAYSYSLKHFAEEFLGATLRDFSYVSNGKLIWATAALELPIAESDPSEQAPNANIGIDARQVAYARSMHGVGEPPRAHHNRPPGYAYLRAALENYAATGEAPQRWNGVDDSAVPATSPFHEWLVAQVDPSGARGSFGTRENLAFDYRAGIADNHHRIARTPEELLLILREVGARDEFTVTARDMIMEWARTSPLSVGIRTERVDGSAYDHGRFGAGSGDVELYEYSCPCGAGRVLEEHANIPGFREHDVRIMCDKCRREWQFVASLPVRQWRLEPVPATTAT